MYVQHMCAWYPIGPTKGTRLPGVTDGCEPSCGQWELNMGPLQEQPVLFTTVLSPALFRHLKAYFSKLLHLLHFDLSPAFQYLL